MARRDDPLNVDVKLNTPRTTWLCTDDVRRLEAAALALGWTESQLLRWALQQSLPVAEEHAARARRFNGTGKRKG